MRRKHSRAIVEKAGGTTEIIQILNKCGAEE
jgi:hypothetical protein